MGIEGIPAAINSQTLQEWVRPRVSEKRFKHICGVADVALELAARSGANQDLAAISALLHDACKEYKDYDLVKQAQQFGLKLHPIEESYGHILHGPVAAEIARSELNITNPVVLNAVREHTLGAVNMSTLSKVLFLADCLEPGRASDYTAPIWKALGKQAVPDLDKAILVACDLNLEHLLQTKRPIHPRTVEVRNFYLGAVRQPER
jgi:predicted HD superfamily hydrolase involved in NAD metabolism